MITNFDFSNFEKELNSMIKVYGFKFDKNGLVLKKRLRTIKDGTQVGRVYIFKTTDYRVPEKLVYKMYIYPGHEGLMVKNLGTKYVLRVASSLNELAKRYSAACVSDLYKEPAYQSFSYFSSSIPNIVERAQWLYQTINGLHEEDELEYCV